MGPGTGRHDEQPAWYLPLRGLQSAQGAALVRHDRRGSSGRRTARTRPGLVRSAGCGARAQRSADVCGQGARAGAGTCASQHPVDRHLARSPHAAGHHPECIERSARPRRAPVGGPAAAPCGHHRGRGHPAVGASRTTRCSWRGWVRSGSRFNVTGSRSRRWSAPCCAAFGSAMPASASRLGWSLACRCCARDAVLMVQLLDNLVDNALKHGGAGKPVEVTARRLGDSVVIAVRDRGPGVPHPQRQRIFDTFQRGDRAMASAGGDLPSRPGAGVGLALCRAIALAHGGELHLRPRSHGGSSFRGDASGCGHARRVAAREAADGAVP